MVRMILAAAMLGGLIAVPPATAGEKKVQPKPGKASGDVTAKLLATLHGTRIQYEKNLNDTPLFELLADLGKRYDVTFMIREEAFREEGLANIREAMPSTTATKLEGITVHRFLTFVLRDLSAAYLIRDGYIEIVPRSTAATEVGLDEAMQLAGNHPDDPVVASVRAAYRVNLPLTSLLVQDRPLDEVVSELARNYDLNVVIHPAAREQMKLIKVNERLLNVPADTMLELLAGLADHSVIRKGNTFRIGFNVGV